MIIYETTAALGYNQKAYLIRLDESENGYNYLCIDGSNLADTDLYIIGEEVEDLEDFYVEETNWYRIEQSPLWGSFLFDAFLKQYSINKVN